MSKLLKTEQQQELQELLINIQNRVDPGSLGVELNGALKFWILDLNPKRIRKNNNNNV